MNAQTLSLSREIDDHMRKSGIRNSGWYVGVTADVPKRLFVDHQVARVNAWWIYRRCSNAAEARALEAAYHQVGCRGAGGGGDDDSVYVYAYVITSATVE
jgi:hypothetical protein